MKTEKLTKLSGAHIIGIVLIPIICGWFAFTKNIKTSHKIIIGGWMILSIICILLPKVNHVYADSTPQIPNEMQLVILGECPTDLRSQVSDELKDPNSFKCVDISGRIFTDSTTNLPIMVGIMRFSAVNTFGATTPHLIGFTILNNGTCDIGEIQ